MEVRIGPDLEDESRLTSIEMAMAYITGEYYSYYNSYWCQVSLV